MIFLMMVLLEDLNKYKPLLPSEFIIFSEILLLLVLSDRTIPILLFELTLLSVMRLLSQKNLDLLLKNLKNTD